MTEATCTSTDPNNHQGDTCPIHEQNDALVAALENAAGNAQWILDWRSDDVPLDAQKVLIDIREKADAALEAAK